MIKCKLVRPLASTPSKVSRNGVDNPEVLYRVLYCTVLSPSQTHSISAASFTNSPPTGWSLLPLS